MSSLLGVRPVLVLNLISIGSQDAFIQKLDMMVICFGQLDIFLHKIRQAPVDLPSEVVSAQIDVINDLGVMVYHEKINEKQNGFDLSYLPTGIYYVVMKTNTGEHFYGKVILNR